MADNQGVRGGVSDIQNPGEEGRGQLLSASLAGRLLMVSPERVRQLAKDGWITKVGKDQYPLVDVVQGYIRFRNDSDRRANRTAAQTRVSDARAREMELRIAEREARLWDAREVFELADTTMGILRTQLSGLPARVTRDLQLRRTIETAIDDILDLIANAAAERGAMVAKNPTTDATVAENVT